MNQQMMIIVVLGLVCFGALAFVLLAPTNKDKAKKRVATMETSKRAGRRSGAAGGGNEANTKDRRRKLTEALAKVEVKAPVVPVVANVLAAPISDPAEIVRRLVEQVTGTVRWRECVAAMAGQGVTTFYEVGSGKVLTGLVKRIADGTTGAALGTPEDIAAFKASRG